ncbi:MAG: hypothetical protein ABSD74_13045 [Rhizomicrobium sp.]|jgi:hypothetical protein
MYKLVRIVAWVFVIFGINASAFGSEAWNCNFVRAAGRAKGSQGAAKIEIANDVLKWEPQISPTNWVPIPYKIAEDNEVGIVAVSSQAQTDKELGPLIGATVLAVNKLDGSLNMGSVMLTGEYAVLSGRCQRQ